MPSSSSLTTTPVFLGWGCASAKGGGVGSALSSNEEDGGSTKTACLLRFGLKAGA